MLTLSALYAHTSSLNNLRVLKSIVTATGTDDKRASASIVATVSALPSATSENPPRHSFNLGRRVSTFLNIGADGSLAVASPAASKRTSAMTNSSFPSDSESVGLSTALSRSNTGTTTRPSMRSFRKSTFVLQKMTVGRHLGSRLTKNFSILGGRNFNKHGWRSR